MEAINVQLDDSLIAVRCATTKHQAPDYLLVENDAEGHRPRMCHNGSGLTASGGDFGFAEPDHRDPTP